LNDYDKVASSTVDVSTTLRTTLMKWFKMADANQMYNLLKDIFFLLDDGDRRLFNGYSLSVPRFYILWHLGNEPGISSRQLSELMICDKSNITRLTQGLEADGLVSRLPHESDGRTLRLYLTEKGETVRAQALNAHLSYNQQRLQCCTDLDQENVHLYLATLKNNLQEELYGVAESLYA
jgi:MarR family transcriptional regulator, organic hydroperoxide resistance regulator